MVKTINKHTKLHQWINFVPTIADGL